MIFSFFTDHLKHEQNISLQLLASDSEILQRFDSKLFQKFSFKRLADSQKRRQEISFQSRNIQNRKRCNVFESQSTLTETKTA